MLLPSHVFGCSIDGRFVHSLLHCFSSKRMRLLPKAPAVTGVQKPGCHGDVFKHIVFCETIKTQQKEHPEGIILVDCFAGQGLYDLSKQKDRAYEKGVAKVLMKMDDDPATKPVQDYVAAIREVDEFMQNYPGSPTLGARLLREQDEHRLIDKHVEDVEGLNDGAMFWQTDAFEEEALEFIVSDEDDRHPVILVDPDYTKDKEDFYQAKQLVVSILKKNPAATIVLFYPLIENSQWRVSVILDTVKGQLSPLNTLLLTNNYSTGGPR